MMKALIAPFLLLLAACGSAGLQAPPTPSTPDETFSAAYTVVEQAYTALSAAYRSGELSRGSTAAAKRQVDEVFAYVDSAHVLYEQGSQYPDDVLLRASEILLAIQRLRGSPQ